MGDGVGVQTDLAAPVDLILTSSDLCSKWGFGDGDEPDWIMDYCEQRSQPFSSVSWHPILRDLVRRFLLPALAEHHEVEVYDIETIHNPDPGGGHRRPGDRRLRP